MRYEFSWKADGESRRFTSGCPQIAEVMLLGNIDIPRLSPAIHGAFEERFGQVRGKFEELLRRHADQPSGEVESGIPGLTIHIRKDSALEVVQ